MDSLLIFVATLVLTYVVLALIPFMVLYAIVDEDAVFDDWLLITVSSVLSLAPGLFAGYSITRTRSQAWITALVTSAVTFVILAVNPFGLLEDGYFPRALLIPPVVATATALVLTRRPEAHVEQSGEALPE